MQAKLLRFLESGEVRRLGENESICCDVRVVCATNRDLTAMVAAGEFREDLYFRVNTFEIRVPPLRERIDDIPLLALRLARRFGVAVNSDADIFAVDTLDALMRHTWPGNVRELANAVEHALILCDSLPIRPEHLPRRFFAPPTIISLPSTPTLNLHEVESQAIDSALARHNGNKSKAAEELGISVKTLYNKLNQLSVLSKTS